ncbi:hypothetical protein THOM_0164 [Trachipleistophora hominis]|uniref:Uncharacterized protein n=1 Tax=Trachipleistophora hominis TaxID=72359 RepID=L7K0A6_TRAHO|nr:hypothetical protein THOM_0164 [Trachipleistophora hominis]
MIDACAKLFFLGNGISNFFNLIKIKPSTATYMRKSITDCKCNKSFVDAFTFDIETMKRDFIKDPTHENLHRIEQKYVLSMIRSFHKNSKKHVLYSIMYVIIIQRLTTNTECKSTLFLIFFLHFIYTNQFDDITYIEITIKDLEKINTIQNPFFAFYLDDLKRKGAFNVQFYPNYYFLHDLIAEIDDIEESVTKLLK